MFTKRCNCKTTQLGDSDSPNLFWKILFSELCWSCAVRCNTNINLFAQTCSTLAQANRISSVTNVCRSILAFPVYNSDFRFSVFSTLCDIRPSCVEATPVPKGYNQNYSGVKVLVHHGGKMPFAFLKRKKKRWTKGRALMSYFQNFQATLLKATSRALDSICKQIVPSSLAYIFSALGCFWRSVAGFCRQYTGSNYIELIASQTFVKFGTVFLQDLSTGLT